MQRGLFLVAVASVFLGCAEDEAPLPSPQIEEIRLRGLSCEAGTGTFEIAAGQPGPEIESRTVALDQKAASRSKSWV